MPDFEAAVAGLTGEDGFVLKGKEQAATDAWLPLWEKYADLREAATLMLDPMVGTFLSEALDAGGPACIVRREADTVKSFLRVSLSTHHILRERSA